MSKNIKNIKRKRVVEDYIRMVNSAIDNYKANTTRWTKEKKAYIEGSEANVERAPYVIGYLHWPEKKEAPKKKIRKSRKKS